MQILHQSDNSRKGRFLNAIMYSGERYWANHIHNSYEILFVIKGEIRICVRGRTETVGENGFAIILPNEVHEIESYPSSEFWIGIYSEDYVHEFTKFQAKKVAMRSSFTCSPEVLNLVRDRLIFAERPGAYMIKACLYALCDEFLSSCEFAVRSDKQYSVMTKIVDYVQSNFKSDISLSSLAESIGYDYSYFSKTFSSLFGMSFSEYLNIYRFNHATALLLQSDTTIRDVAMESGFKSVRTFNEVFKSIAKISPSEFRRSLAQGAD